MAGSLRSRRRAQSTDYWPGFVDAMATLLLVIIFLLSIFMIAQFFLSQQLSGRDTVLNRLNIQISELTELLALERANSGELEDTILGLQASLSDAEAEQTRLTGPARQQLRRGRHRRRPGGKTGKPSRRRTSGQPGGAGPGRTSQPADRRPAPPDRRRQCRARSLRSQGIRKPGQDRQPRPPSERRPRPARSGAVPLPLRLLRPPA
jgi:hypothetical protein